MHQGLAFQQAGRCMTFYLLKKELHMRLLLTYFSLVFMTTSLWAGVVIDSNITDLGSGYRKVRAIEKVSAASSETEQFTYLYYKDKKLGQASKYSISPSGEYLIFQDSTTGDIFLFDSASGKLELQKITKIVPVRKFSWNERMEYVKVRFTGKVPSINLPFE